jgi:DNA-binding response OmpR family regulator
MILSAIGTSSEKAALLDLGADDYLAKPFAGDELVARVRVLLRRNNPELKFGNLVLNSETRTMRVDEHETALQNKEYLLLRTLMQSPGKVFNKAYLYKKVWEMSEDVESNVVETTVNKLRRRLKDAGTSVQIKNVRNTGYWIEE